MRQCLTKVECMKLLQSYCYPKVHHSCTVYFFWTSIVFMGTGAPVSTHS